MDESCVEVPTVGTSKKNSKKDQDKSPEEQGSAEKNSEEPSASPSSRSSPEANCPICLGKPENKSFTDSCLHQFCFTCLLEWSKVKAECPLCKQSFKSIIHTVRSIEDYEQYYLTAPSENGRVFLSVRPAFRYRTTVSSYLDYYVRLGEAFSHHVIPPMSPPSTHSGITHWQRRRQTGVSDFRRNIYQQGLWVQPTRDVTGRVRDSSPEFYRDNPALTHRLVPWLNRELNVLISEPDRVHLAINNIMEWIKQVPIRSSRFNCLVSPHLGRHTEHFVHEFYSFATSPYDLAAYDRFANYVDFTNLAHEMTAIISENESDSDVQIVGSFPSRSTAEASSAAPILSPTSSIRIDDSESDECVVVENVRPEPEVITLESEPEDDIFQVNIHIGADTGSQPGPSQKLFRKKNFLRLKPKSNNYQCDVSINIGHSVPLTPSMSSCSSDSSYSPTQKRTKNKIKVLKKKKTCKGKSLVNKSKGKTNKGSKHKKGCDSPVFKPKRRTSSVVLKSSSSDEESDTLHIVTEYSSFSSDESDFKPRLRSVVVKSNNIKPQPIPSPEPTPSPLRSDTQSSFASIEKSNDVDYTSQSNISSVQSYNSWMDYSGPSCSYRTRSYSTSSSEGHYSRKRKKCSKKRTK